MKTFKKQTYLKLVDDLYTDLSKQKELEKKIKEAKERVKELIGEDKQGKFGEIEAKVNEICRESCDYKKAVNDGIDLSGYMKTTKYKTLKLIKK